MAKNCEIVCLDESNDVICLDETNEDLGVPDSGKCQELVETFVSLTNTDEALAQFFLQDHKWELQSSLDAYFASGLEENTASSSREPEPEVIFMSKSATPFEGKCTLTPPDEFSVITWNVDGLDEHNLKKRMKAVSKIIETNKPDIVFLQEVIPITFSYLEDRLPQYRFIAGGSSDYFAATLVSKTTVVFDGSVVHPFANSRMGRNLIGVECHIGKLKLQLLNAHLESTKDFSSERIQQLKLALQLTQAQPNLTTIFGGDLNLRDSEAEQANIPQSIRDVWELCGKRQECKFTWDTVRNSNKSIVNQSSSSCKSKGVESS